MVFTASSMEPMWALLLDITWRLAVLLTLIALATNTVQKKFLEQSLFPDFQFLQEVEPIGKLELIG